MMRSLCTILLAAALFSAGCVKDDAVSPPIGTNMSWEEIPFPLFGSTWIDCMAIDRDGRVFLAGGTRWDEPVWPLSILYVSEDNGATWAGEKRIGDFSIVTLEADSEGRLFARDDAQGVWLSADHAESWKQVAPVGADTLGLGRNITIDRNDNVYVPTSHGGFYVSRDHGESWTLTARGLPPYRGYVVSIGVNSRGNIFAFTTGGLFRSDDGGETWVGLKRVWGSSRGEVLIGSLDQMLVRTDGGLYASVDEGRTWTIFHPPSHLDGISMGAGDRLLAIGSDSLFVSDDNGGHWTAVVGYNEYWNYPHSVESNSAGDIFLAGSWGVSRSIDGGIHWEMLGFTTYPPMDIAVDEGGTLSVGMELGGIYRWAPDRKTWSTFSRDLPITSLRCLAQASESTLAAGMLNGIYITPVDRSQWRCAGLQDLDIRDLFSLSGDTLAAYAYSSGLFLSTDGGAAWRNIGLVGYDITALVRTREGRLLCGASFGGVFRYTGEGAIWDQMNEGLGDLRVNALAVTSAGNIVVGTERGLYLSSNEGVSWRRFGAIDAGIFSLLVMGEDIFIGTRDRGVLWTRTGVPELHFQNDGLPRSSPVYTIVPSPDRHLYLLSWERMFRSTLSVDELSAAGR